MTDAVKNLTATGYEDGLYRRSRLDRKKAQSLRTDKQAAITFKSDKTNEYKKEVAGLTDKEAAKLGKNALKNEKAAAVVDNRMVHIDARSMEEAKKKHPEFEHVLIGTEKRYEREIQRMIKDNPEDFIVNGKFSSDAYKRQIGRITGFDNRLNIDERRAGADIYNVRPTTMKHAAKIGGYEYEKDLTNLYKTLSALGCLGAGAGLGALVANKFVIPFDSNVVGDHIDGSEEIVDTIIHDGKLDSASGALIGLLGAAIPAVLAAIKVKDNGQADIFKGISAEAIVEDGDRNLESKIKGSHNQKIMREILKMENLTNEDKALILKLGYGELTGKKVNDRELLAAYEIAKFCNKYPEKPAKEFDKLPGTVPEKQEQPVVTPPAVQPPSAGQTDNQGCNNNNGNNTCQLNVYGNGDGIATVPYKVVRGDDPYRVTKGLYKRADGKPMTHDDIMALRNDIFGKNKGLRVGTIELPKNKTVNGVQYVYHKGEVEQTTPENVKLEYYDNSTKHGKSETFRVEEGCGNTVIQTGFATKEAAETFAKTQATTNPNKYIFVAQ